MTKSFTDILKQTQAHPLLSTSLWESHHYIFKLDEPSDFADIDPMDLPSMIERTTQLLKQNQSCVGIGRYGEKRQLYQHPQYGDRCFHLGIDICTRANTPIYAPLDGQVHQLKNHDQAGDYGPTIILQHQIQGHTFFTLYGHLSYESLQRLSIQQVIKAGDCIGTIGSPSINGGWPPHCHFQIIQNLRPDEDNFPGVCSEKDKQTLFALCPDPNLLLKRYSIR